MQLKYLGVQYTSKYTQGRWVETGLNNKEVLLAGISEHAERELRNVWSPHSLRMSFTSDNVKFNKQKMETSPFVKVKFAQCPFVQDTIQAHPSDNKEMTKEKRLQV